MLLSFKCVFNWVLMTCSTTLEMVRRTEIGGKLSGLEWSELIFLSRDGDGGFPSGLSIPED